MERRWRGLAGTGSTAVDMTVSTPKRSDEGLVVTISRGTPASWHCLPPSLAAQTSESGRRGAGLVIVSIPPLKHQEPCSAQYSVEGWAGVWSLLRQRTNGGLATGTRVGDCWAGVDRGGWFVATAVGRLNARVVSSLHAT